MRCTVTRIEDGRLTLRVAGIADPQGAAYLRALLASRAGIEGVLVDADAGRIVLLYQRARVTSECIVRWIEEATLPGRRAESALLRTLEDRARELKAEVAQLESAREGLVRDIAVIRACLPAYERALTAEQSASAIEPTTSGPPAT